MFLAIVLVIWLVAMVIWWLFSSAFRRSDVDKLKQRLLGTAKKKEKTRQGPSLIQTDSKDGVIAQRVIRKLRLQVRLQELLEQAGMKWTPVKLIHTSLLMLVVGAGAGWLLLPSDMRQLCFLSALVGAVLPLLFVMRKKKSRLRRFEELFPDSLDFVARSMRAGHAFSVSLEMIHREFQEPLAGEFKRTFEEHNLGLPLDLALQKLAKRVPSLDVHFFVSAVLLQKRTGGNLAEILDKLSYVIRERFKLRGKIRAISAHGRMTGYALTAIPAVVAILMFYVNPEYVRFFSHDEVGHYMAAAAIALQLIGYFVISQIVKIEV